MEKKPTTSSLREFGYTTSSLRHSRIGSYNWGKLYPLGWHPVKIGDTIENDIDLFARSSALVDPSFLDCDITVAHYFVPYQAVDPLYEARTQRWKGSTSNEIYTPLTKFNSGQVGGSADGSAPLHPWCQPGSLLDHLNFQLGRNSLESSDGTWASLDLRPLLSYHMIADLFFTNSKIQDSMYTKNWCATEIPALGYVPVVPFDKVHGKDADFIPRWDSDLDPGTKEVQHSFFALRDINFEPDYFTSARATAAGPTVTIPGTSDSAGTIHQLLDAMLVQKVGDMLQRGGYSYLDYARVIYGVTGLETETKDPIFLGGSSGPLQVSTVVNTANNLGQQGGTVAGSVSKSNGFKHTFAAAGIYMPVMFIRPKTYYTAGVNCHWNNTNLSRQVIPQLADCSDAPILLSEISDDYADWNVDSRIVETPNPRGVFGWKDRYEEERTQVNTVHGEMRTTRLGWFAPREVREMKISADFLNMSYMKYTPWVQQLDDVDHFFVRTYHDMTITQLLPVSSQPYIW